MGTGVDREYKGRYERAFGEILASRQGGYFDEAALPSYTHVNGLMKWLFWQRIRVALGLAGELRGGRVLDFGCGGGVTFVYLQGRGCEIVGCEKEHVELAEAMCGRLGVAAKICPGIEEVEGEFDLILALDVLEHVDDLPGVVGRLAGLLKDGGRLVVSGPTENWLYRLGRRLAGFSGHYHVRDIYDIEEALEESGLQRVGGKVLFPVLALFRVSRWEKRA